MSALNGFKRRLRNQEEAMPIYIEKGKIHRYCDIPDCNAEVLGLFRCHCGDIEGVFCEEHACTCSTKG